MVLSIILDTNFIVIPADYGVDIFSEAETILERRIEFVLLQSVVKEIEEKASRTKARQRKFRVAKDLFDRCNIIEVSESLASLPVDDQLLEYTIKMKGVLATNDKELRRRAREKGVPVLYLRGKKRLILEGSVI